MFENPGRKVTLIFTLLLISLGFLALKQPAFNLGLDLRGGTRLVYRFDFENAVEEGKISASEDPSEVLQQTISILRTRVDPDGTREVVIRQSGSDQIVIELPGNVGGGKVEAESTLKTALQADQGVTEIELVDASAFPETGVVEIGTEHVRYEAKSRDRLLRCQRQHGASTLAAHTTNSDVKLIFGDSIRAAIENLGELQFLIIADNVAELQALGTDFETEQQKLQAWRESQPEGTPLSNYNYVEGDEGPTSGLRWFAQAVPDGSEISEFDRANIVLLPTEDKYDFRGEDLARVFPSQDEFGFPAVGFEIKPERSQEFGGFTKENKNRRMAIVLNEEITSAPEIQGALFGSSIIRGNFTAEEVRNAMTILRAGSLKLRPTLESDERVGASLGDDYVNRGFISGVMAIVLVLIFMVFYYKRLGMLAAISLIANFSLLMGGLSFLDATLTLPGIAGLILTVGMAVDANILIFDRLREESDKGRSARQAAKAGFDKALSAILDANITTFLTALILYKVGTGPVRGFAATLMVGIITSVFAALVITRVLVHFSLEKGAKSYPVGTWFVKANYNFLPKAKTAMMISGALIVLGLGIFINSPDMERLGIDFTGGVEAQLVTKEPQDIDGIRKRVKDIPTIGQFAQVIPVLNSADGDGYTRFRVTVKTVSEETEIGQGKELQPILRDSLGDVLLDEAIQIKLDGTALTGSIIFNGVHPRDDIETKLASLGLNTPTVTDGQRKGSYDFQAEAATGRNTTELKQAIEGAFVNKIDSNQEKYDLSSAIASFSQVGPQVVGELRDKAVMALLISLFVIVMYIRVRFAEYSYGWAAVCALTHDVLITLGVMTVANKIGLINGEINLPMIAAFLTIIGYSLNDTIVIFDRVRENLPRSKGPLSEVLTLSINQTLSRTVLTSFTTFIAVAVLFVVNLGTGNVLESFSFAMMVGVITGTYSTIFIANPVLLWLESRKGRQTSSSPPSTPKDDEDYAVAKA